MQYSDNVNKILSLASQEARRLGNDAIMPDHLLLAILRLGTGQAYGLLMMAGVDADEVKHEIDTRLYNASGMANDLSQRPYSRATARILRLTMIEAGLYGASQAGSAHLLLSILRERVNFPAMHLEQTYSIDYERIEFLYPKPQSQPADSSADYDLEDDNEEDDIFSRITGHLMGTRKQRPSSSKSDTPSLDKFGRDLSRQALEGKLDPVVGRQDEINRVIQILSRRKKNNPILIGDPGVGKSAVVEGLAQLLAQSSHPEWNKKRIISLDLASVVAGTTYRGQFEQRMKDLTVELRRHPEIILFIDEIHTIMGAGNAQGSLDAANILKPALARGEIQCIGATTTAEYRTTIEKDGALCRRFQQVQVRPSSIDETYQILLRLSQVYGEFHHVRYSEEVLRACATLSDRYISSRALPDKAIDAMDEAGARFAHATKMVTITPEHVSAVISSMSGIPVQRVTRKENEQLLLMDQTLREKVIGQDEAIAKVVRAIRRSRLGLRDPRRPIGSFFFLGPTGVGKTYLAQCLAEQMFGTRDAIIRFDMSEYMEKHTASLLVGAPPGYIAHEDGGKLTEAVRRRPYSIVLFDEIEKAHPDIFNVLLQVLDEGRLTDRQGHSVDFRNTIIILTSNVGTAQLRDFGAGVGFSSGDITSEMAEHVLTKALNKTFPPEFVNRIDDIISFGVLSRACIARILHIEVQQLCQRLRLNGHVLHVSPQVEAQLLDKCYDPKFGARPVRRTVQTYLEDAVTETLLLHPDQKNISIKSLKTKLL